MMEEFQGDDEDLKWMWDEAAAGELMMEQTLMSQLHHFEFCLNVEERPFSTTRWQGLDVAFSINSVFPPPQRPTRVESGGRHQLTRASSMIT